MRVLVDDIEKYGRPGRGEITLLEAVTALVAARDGNLAPLGAADLLANWKTARAELAAAAEYAKEAAPDVPPEDPWENLTFAKECAARSRAKIADLDFAMQNSIAPARFED
ncbi:hypothetical protein [Streptomyces californicus]|uniref:hypothetical protein n=1 Tax=Streptomyces californicus TaxID=67351 RepID=UPI00371C63DE